MSGFMSVIKSTLNDEFSISVTKNGAIGYRTIGKELLDLNFAVTSPRRTSLNDIADRFVRTFFEDKITAMKWLFSARDVREDLGEHRLFRIVFQRMAGENPEYIVPLLPLVPEYGRYDDLWCLFDTKPVPNVLNIITQQLREDIQNLSDGNGISPLAEWLPSANAHSADTKCYAKQIYKFMGISERGYRKMLSKLRSKLNIVEEKMSEKRWDEIAYEAVPSHANLIYNSAFLRNDEDRCRDFLSRLGEGETKINAPALFLHGIVAKYSDGQRGLRPTDKAPEALWNALPDTVDRCDNTIIVANGGDSMTVNAGDGNVTALTAASAPAIYFAERSSDQFKDNYITSSERPQLVDLGKGKNLREKVQIALKYSEVANINIEAAFDLILTTAKRNNMEQSSLPTDILTTSDTEFDYCATSNGGSRYTRDSVGSRLFDRIARRCEDAGYKLPRPVFWNVNSRMNTIPIKGNEMGVALVSGFSLNITKMMMSGQTDPYECLLETLDSDRYRPVGDTLENQ